MFRELKSRTSADDGIAMVFVMGAIALISAIAVGGWALASQTLHESVKGQDLVRAYQAASTGLEEEISFFSPSRLGQYPRTVSYGTDSYTARIADLGGGAYELICDGRSGTASETVLVRFRYLDLWDMNISGGAGSNIGAKNAFNGSSWIYGSLYVDGDVEWGSNGRLYAGPVFLKNGVWVDSGNGKVGAIGNFVDAYGPVKSDPSDGYYTELRGSAPEIDVPILSDDNMADYLKAAKNTDFRYPPTGAEHPNASATYYTVWNGPSTIGGASFGNTGTDGTPRDAIAFDQATGILYLADDAVIYCDDIVTFTADVRQYKGRGIIVGRNGFVIEGSLVPCQGLTEVLGVPGDQRTVPVMQADCLGLLSQGDVSITSPPALGTFPAGGVAAAIFTNGVVRADASSHCDFRGSLICDSIELQSTNVVLATQPGLSKSLPQGMPQLSGFTARSDWVRR